MSFPIHDPPDPRVGGDRVSGFDDPGQLVGDLGQNARGSCSYGSRISL